MSDNGTDNLAAVTEELLELENNLDSDIDGLRQRQEAAIRRLQTAIEQVKIGKIADSLRAKSE